MSAEVHWDEPVATLDQRSIRALLAGGLPAIHLPGFASVEECQRLARVVHEQAAAARAAVTSPMSILGANLSNFHGRSKADYFADAARAYRDVSPLIAASFDPLERIVAHLREAWPAPVGVAREGPPYGRYYACGIKSRGAGSALHYDFVPHLLDGYAICAITDQFSWNLYLEVPGGTGATTVYATRVQGPRTDGAREQWNNLVNPETVAGVRAYTFMPRVGEVVLFNTRCPHSIEVQSLHEGERRTQVGSFIGRLPDDELVLWS